MSLKSWNTYKMYAAPLVALVLWGISVICFVFGLSFKNPLIVMGKDISIQFSFALAMCMTVIQVVGNGRENKDDGIFKWIWWASYVLGISSNTNTLLGILGLGNPLLEWGVALPLGAIIEIAPEKLIVMWIESLPVKSQPQKPNTQKPINRYVPQHKPDHLVTPNIQRAKQGINPVPSSQLLRPTPKPYPRPSGYLQAIQEMEEDGEFGIAEGG